LNVLHREFSQKVQVMEVNKKLMKLLRRIAISNRDNKRKEAATAAITEKDQDVVASWNESLEDEVWQKIVEALATRGHPAARKDVQARKN
jgi:hypothetical protein